ncbi:class I SAM-dependent methyltransferase [Methanogenium sp. MK-MG]|uniref:class I SAM-dependent methyltransferase n=1 Tax=Methanogenium sp. MK-MG TaxID=2599926 RepID=UPI0020B14149|nr:class I SAM-dependent methyltransferase [Methanogenium sp. MK-MG]KAF1078712.1 Ubiquinone/menaquinone biosynthesis C-methyltransferase UbiE [Methanogenium sp. MK-MG]
MMTESRKTGRNREAMSGIGFRLMSLMFRIRNMVNPPGELLNEIGIDDGMVVVDYGCGPGSYIKDASAMVGAAGMVYAVDIHELAIASVRKLIQKEGLKNVVPVQANGYTSSIEDHTADLIYALDMFHAIGDPDAFLTELHRIVKPGGMLVIDDGHQPREAAKEKILHSGLWEITEERDAFMRCTPAETE